MLSETYQRKYFGMDKKGAKFSIGDRLTRLYRIKELVLSFMDEEEAENISDEFLARVMNQWIYWNEENDVDQFFKYMRDQGYIKKPFKSDPTYIWILIDVRKEEAPYNKYKTVTINDGSASYIQTHEVSSDVFAASHSWSKPKNTYKANEEVSLSLYVQITTYDWQDDDYPYFHEGLNNMTSTIGAWFDDPKVDYSGRGYNAIRFEDKDGKLAASVKTDYGKIIKQSESSEFKANFPAGYNENETIGIHVVSSPVGKYVYIYQWQKE